MSLERPRFIHFSGNRNPLSHALHTELMGYLEGRTGETALKDFVDFYARSHPESLLTTHGEAGYTDLHNAISLPYHCEWTGQRHDNDYARIPDIDDRALKAFNIINDACVRYLHALDYVKVAGRANRYKKNILHSALLTKRAAIVSHVFSSIRKSIAQLSDIYDWDRYYKDMLLQPSPAGNTILHLALYTGNKEIIDFVLNELAILEPQERKAMLMAPFGRDRNILHLLLSGAKEDMPYIREKVIQFAIDACGEEEAERLLTSLAQQKDGHGVDCLKSGTPESKQFWRNLVYTYNETTAARR
ncbi:MAG: hypothetical protein KGJ06_06285 [Pseudomonadota bacterium]|nr:hypothetical protein [Pseudomonadota bacterium]